MKQYLLTHSADETRGFGKKFAAEIAPGTLICLSGDLGAGKTTFTQGFLEGSGAIRPYTSPTFVIMKQYELPEPTVNGIRRIYHVDAYRVEVKDFETLGFREWYEDKEGVVILEWPERVKSLIPRDAKQITLCSKSETEREITLEM